jgi:hypothetical protein
VKVGPTYRDIDEVSDLRYLWQIFSTSEDGEDSDEEVSLIRPVATLTCLSNHSNSFR